MASMPQWSIGHMITKLSDSEEAKLLDGSYTLGIG